MIILKGRGGLSGSSGRFRLCEVTLSHQSDHSLLVKLCIDSVKHNPPILEHG